MKFELSYTPAVVTVRMVESPTAEEAPKLWKQTESMMRTQRCRRVLFDCRGVAPKVDPEEAKDRASAVKQQVQFLKYARMAVVYDDHAAVAQAFTEKMLSVGYDVEAFTDASQAMSWLNADGDKFVDEAVTELVEG